MWSYSYFSKLKTKKKKFFSLLLYFTSARLSKVPQWVACTHCLLSPSCKPLQAACISTIPCNCSCKITLASPLGILTVSSISVLLDPLSASDPVDPAPRPPRHPKLLSSFDFQDTMLSYSLSFCHICCPYHHLSFLLKEGTASFLDLLSCTLTPLSLPSSLINK